MLTEQRECLDAAMIRWRRHHAELIRNSPPRLEADGSLRAGHACDRESEVYAFAYWLIRHSGLVIPTALDR